MEAHVLLKGPALPKQILSPQTPKPKPKPSSPVKQSPKSLDTSYWVAVKELNLSYYIGETPLFTIYTHYDNLI